MCFCSSASADHRKEFKNYKLFCRCFSNRIHESVRRGDKTRVNKRNIGFTSVLFLKFKKKQVQYRFKYKNLFQLNVE